MVIVAVVGLPGAGKTEVTKLFEQRGFSKVYFGRITFDLLAEQGKEPTEENQRILRERLREEQGMAAYGTLNLPRVKELVDAGNDVVLESFYSWSSYKLYREEFGDDFVVVSVVAPRALRYARLADRPERSMTPDQAKRRDTVQIENIEQAGPIAMGDFFILNTDTLEELQAQVDAALATLQR